MYYTYEYCGEMYHSGIKGMKWYVRRFQNEDGTLTEEGRARYRRQVNKLQTYEKKAEKSKSRLTSRNLRKETRYGKKALKLEKKAMKELKKSEGFFGGDKHAQKYGEYKSKALKYEKKANKLASKRVKNTYSYERYNRKGRKLVAKMNSEYENTPVRSLDKESYAYVQDYVRRHML